MAYDECVQGMHKVVGFSSETYSGVYFYLIKPSNNWMLTEPRIFGELCVKNRVKTGNRKLDRMINVKSNNSSFAKKKCNV